MKINTPLRYDGLQALRFIAAAMVVLTHSTLYVSERLDRNFEVWTAGTTGVDIFFVISGFVMIVSSLGLLSRDDGARVFLTRRFVRIIPLYWAATTLKLLILLATPALVLHTSLNWSDTLMSYLFLPALNQENEIKPLLGVGWTLNYEMFFYVLFALAMWMRVDAVKFIAALFVTLAVIGGVLQPENTAAKFYTDNIVLGFLFGMIVARWCIARRDTPPSPWLSVAFIAIGFAGLLYPYVGLPYYMRPLVRDLPAAAIVFGVAFLEPVLRGRIPAWLLLLGDSSYALYLIHPLVAPVVPMMMAKFHFGGPVLSVIGSLSLSIAVSIVIYLVAEKPTTERLKRLFEPKRPNARVMADSASV